MELKTEYVLISLVLIIMLVLSFQFFGFLVNENKENKKVTATSTPTTTIKMISNKIIKLPEPKYESDTSVEEALLGRRSRRSYKDEGLSLGEISQLLWAAQGITNPKRGFRTAPSAGATYPLETYLIVGNVKNLKPGVYHYDPKKHTIEMTIERDVRRELANAAFNQYFIADAPVSIAFTAIYERTTRIYGDRGVMYVHMEVGHAAQNVYLECESLRLGTVVVGAFYDEEVKKVLDLGDTEEVPLYIMPVGKNI
jgi:SagB-type dehydrogenase family enzyme